MKKIVLYNKDDQLTKYILANNGFEDYYKPYINPQILDINRFSEQCIKDYKIYKDGVVLSDGCYLIYTYEGKHKIYDLLENEVYIVKDSK